MAVTQIKICNLALAKIGAARISDITQDTKSAILLNSIYELIRDQVLRAHPWNFATKRATISPNASTPDFEYDYTYDLPNDCLKVLDTYPDNIEHVIEGRTILTNEETLDLKYIYQNTDESLWDSCFANAFAARLAQELAYSMTQSSTLVEQMKADYKNSLAEARAMDGTEGTLKGLEVDDWTDSRK